MSKIHELKTWPEYYEEIFMDRKKFEVRSNDRDFNVGDKIILQEWDPKTEEYSGRELARTITFILEGGQFGIREGVSILSIA